MFCARIGLFSLIFHSLCWQINAEELETELCFVYSKDEFGLGKKAISAEYCYKFYEECCDEGCCIKSKDEEDSISVETKVALGIAIVVAVLVLFCYLCYNKKSSAESSQDTSNSTLPFRRRNRRPDAENGGNITEIGSDTVRLNADVAPSAPPADLSTAPITPPPSYDSVHPDPFLRISNKIPSYEDVMKDKMKS